MKKRLKLFVGLTMGVFMSSLAWVGLAQAQTFTTNVKPNQTIDSSVYSAGKTVTVNGTINGDLYCAGQNVMIDATVKGDILCAGQTITVKGTVEGNIRVAGQTITVDAQVSRAATVMGDMITVTKNAQIGRDATITGSTVTIDGKIGRDAVIAAGKTDLSGTIGRNTQFDGNQLSVVNDGAIKGNLVYTSTENAVVTQQQVGGNIDHNTPKQEKPSKAMFFGASVKIFIFFALAMIFFALMLVLAWPQAFHRVSGIAVRGLGKTVLAGFLASIVVPMILIGLSFSVIGIPLAIFVFLAWILIAMLSMPVTAYYLGSMILAKSKQPIPMMLLGIVLLCILFYLPIIGIIVMFVSHWIGTGAILLAAKARIPKPVYRVE